MKHLIFKILRILIIAYIATLVILYFTQRQIIFPAPQMPIAHPESFGLKNFREAWINSDGSTNIKIWHNDLKSKNKILVYFHGNGAVISSNTKLYSKLNNANYGVLAMSYRGYGDSEGFPSELGILADAQAVIGYIKEKTDAEISLIGRSIGTGVATQIAAKNDLDKLVLISPYTSVTNLAAEIYWFFPVKYLIKDPFDSLSVMQNIDEPILIIHGDNDKIIPISYGMQLYEAINSKKKFVTQKNRGHNDLDMKKIFDEIKGWI